MHDKNDDGVDPLDRSKFPADLSYLIEPSTKYGGLMGWDGPPSRRLKKREVAELQEVGRQIGWNNHDAILDSWVVEHSIARHTREVEAVEGLIILMEYLGIDTSDYGPKQEPEWTLGLWNTLHFRALQGRVDVLREVLTDDAAFEVVVKTLKRVPSDDLPQVAFFMLHEFETQRTLDWIEAHATDVFSSSYWEDLVAVSEFSWPRAASWLERGMPLSLIALDVLVNLAGESESPVVIEANPKLLEPVPLSVASPILDRYAASDPTPHVVDAVKFIREHWSAIIGSQS